jgi:hypothetical protein
VTQVEVSLGTIVGHVDFSVLEWIHRSGINIEVGVELLDGDSKSPEFQQKSDGCCGDAFAK